MVSAFITLVTVGEGAETGVEASVAGETCHACLTGALASGNVTYRGEGALRVTLASWGGRGREGGMERDRGEMRRRGRRRRKKEGRGR